MMYPSPHISLQTAVVPHNNHSLYYVHVVSLFVIALYIHMYLLADYLLYMNSYNLGETSEGELRGRRVQS